jgi:hypothetical protein
MNIEFIEPLSRSWDRMKTALFRPFDIGKWFVLGFAVFLSQLMSGGGNGTNFSIPSDKEAKRFPDIENIPRNVMDWIATHPGIMILIAFGILILIAIGVVLAWLSARGTFIFLDNVAQNRALIAKPWSRYRELGNSLFFWRILFGIAVLLLILPLLVLTYFQIVNYIHTHSLIANIGGVIVTVLLWLAVWVATGYISMFVNNFVVPVMYRHDLKILQAWQRFFRILSSHFPYFVLYGLFLLLLWIATSITILVAGCMTCCIGFIPLIIPYINCVVLLPVSYTFRAYSLEFLAQWGPDYSVFHNAETPVEDVAPPPVPPPLGEGI